MNINEQFWNYFADDASTSLSDSEMKAWSYDGAKFQQHNCLSYLKNKNSVCSIVRNDGPELEEIGLPYLKEKLPFSSLNLVYHENIPARKLDIFRNYWALKLASQINTRDVPFTMVHMAISLDGKISTLSGDSKWIGNNQNLDHAHRLRAILDGILVGAGTVQRDSPSLNVRRVSGKSPARFILSNKSECFERLKKLSDVDTYLVRHEKFATRDTPATFDDVIIYKGGDKKSQVKSILRGIRAKGIKSLLIEGGPATVSTFLEAEAVDVLQLHHTPLLLGSGKNMIELPTIDTIKEGKHLKHSFYTPMGNAIMSTSTLC